MSKEAEHRDEHPLEQEQEQEQEQRLRQLLDHTLRGLPHRPAPRTLQTRVLRELHRRAAQPWWRHSFAHWPLPARTAFVVLCIAVTTVALLGSDWTATTVASLRAPDASAVFPTRQLLGYVAVLTSLADVPIRMIQPLWLYSALAAAAALYAMLFGLGAFAYRTLYLKPLGR